MRRENGKIIMNIAEDRYMKRRAVESINARYSDKLDLKKRLPHYEVEVNDFDAHEDMDLEVLLPYIYYLTAKDENGKYLYEPDDTDLNLCREYLEETFIANIVIERGSKDDSLLIEDEDDNITDEDIIEEEEE